MNNTNIEQTYQVITSLQRDLNLATAFLLLSGQITIVGVFVTAGGFIIALSGPILGGTRLAGRSGNKIANSIVDIIDVLLAILLIIDEIRITGVVVGPGRFSVDVSGPIFGLPINEPSLPILRKNYNFFHEIVSNHFQIDPTIFRNLEKE